MRYAQIRKMDISNGEGVGVSLFVQGCHFHCPGCHNPEQWSFSGGKEYTINTESRILELIEPEYITRFSILGGEPLEKCNWLDLAALITAIKSKKPSIKIWLYTGYELDNLASNNNPLLQTILLNVDYIVDGQFVQEEKDITLQFRGSGNQNIYHRSFDSFIKDENFK